MLFAIFVIVAFSSVAISVGDDGDGIIDSEDNCIDDFNPNQTDTDKDGYGNFCDGDFNNDGIVEFPDNETMGNFFYTNNPETDLNGDLTTDFLDLGRLTFLWGKEPGPSGLGCAGSQEAMDGTIPCLLVISEEPPETNLTIEDNCVDNENPSQIDTDKDGYGNFCDGDFDNDGIVGESDLDTFAKFFFTDFLETDLNGDLTTDFLDLGRFAFIYGTEPGPSSLSCAGTSSAMDGTIPCLARNVQMPFETTMNNEDPDVIKTKEGIIYLVWYSDRSGNSEIWIKNSTDAVSWSEPKKITDSLYPKFYSSISQSPNGDGHLTWFESGPVGTSIWYSSSSDFNNWSQAINLTSSDSVNWAPNIFADKEGKLYLYWASDSSGNKEIYVRTLDFGGSIWSEPVQITNHSSNDDFPYVIENSDGGFSMVWSRYEGENWVNGPSLRVIYATSDDGINWNEDGGVPKTPSVIDTYPMLYEHGGLVFVSWTTTRFDIYGDIVSAPISDLSDMLRINENPYPDYFGKVLSLGEERLVVWVTDIEADGQERDIFSRII